MNFLLKKKHSTLVLNRDMMPVSYLPITTMDWEVAIKAIYLGAVDIVHEYEDWRVHSPSTTIKVPSVVVTKEYIKFKKMIPWNTKYIHLRDGYTCQYCDKKFDMADLTLDHVLPRKYGGLTTWENISSACSPCNHKRGHNRNIRPKNTPYKPDYWELIGKLKKEIIEVPDKSWIPYLQWNENNIFIKE